METTRVAIIGTGVGIRTHLAGIKKSCHAEVIGVVGRSLQRTRELLTAAGENPDLAKEWEYILDSNPDLICIATPISARNEYYESLKGYQGHLIVEKPVLTNSKDSDYLKSCIPLCFHQSYTDFQLRGLKAFQTIKSWIADGLIGVPYYMSMYERTGSMRNFCLPQWQYSRKLGGGQVFSMGSHLVDLSVYLLSLSYSELCQAKTWVTTAIPRGEWCNENITLPSDEFCAISIRNDSCCFDLKSSAITLGDRLFGILIEGTEGTIEFTYKNGIASCTYWFSGKEKATLYLNESGGFSEHLIDGLNPSIFRLAYPGYFEEIISEIQTGKKTDVASIEDGIANTVFLENANYLEINNVEKRNDNSNYRQRI